MAGLGAELSAIAPGLALRKDGSVVSWGGERPADEPEPDLPLASTRLGGRPDLAPSAAWPSFEDRPMAFVAQVNLAEVSPLDERGLLPPSGLLSFFGAPADLDQPGSWHVSFTEDAAAVAKLEFPADLSFRERYATVALRAQRELTSLPMESETLADLGLTWEERIAYGDALRGEEGPRHRMLGHPDVVQSDPRDEEPGLCLLLQVDSDEDAGMMWGDVGRLYFWIRRDDLERRRFDRCELIFQSH